MTHEALCHLKFTFQVTVMDIDPRPAHQIGVWHAQWISKVGLKRKTPLETKEPKSEGMISSQAPCLMTRTLTQLNRCNVPIPETVQAGIVYLHTEGTKKWSTMIEVLPHP